MFYERLKTLCDQNNISVSVFAKDVLNVSASAATGWKNGASPNSEILIKTAQYFHVSIDYLLGVSSSSTTILGELSSMYGRPIPRTVAEAIALLGEANIPLSGPSAVQASMKQLDTQKGNSNTKHIFDEELDVSMDKVKKTLQMLPASIRVVAANTVCDLLIGFYNISMAVSKIDREPGTK